MWREMVQHLHLSRNGIKHSLKIVQNLFIGKADNPIPLALNVFGSFKIIDMVQCMLRSVDLDNQL